MKNQIFMGVLVSVLLTLFIGLVLAEGESGSEKIIIKGASFIAPSPEKENLNGEWVEIANQGSSDQSLDKWTLEDNDNHTYAFENFTLKAGSSAKVHTGKGENTLTDLYWGRSSPIWNNDGDIATLKDASGKFVASYPKEAKGV